MISVKIRYLIIGVHLVTVMYSRGHRKVPVPLPFRFRATIFTVLVPLPYRFRFTLRPFLGTVER